MIEIPQHIRHHKKLTDFEKVLCVEIITLIHQKGYCKAKNAYFARVLDKTEQTIKRTLTKLKKKQIITTKGIGRNRQILVYALMNKEQEYE